MGFFSQPGAGSLFFFIHSDNPCLLLGVLRKFKIKVINGNIWVNVTFGCLFSNNPISVVVFLCLLGLHLP